jgi:low temperature requirement protein LtrA
MNDPDPQTPSPELAAHGLKPMSGRDPHEENRVSTPLELLFDLTLVIGIGFAAEQFAHFIAEEHFQTALIGFGFAMFGLCWAWINFSWFSSAYDTDDWAFRLATMVQMVGVIVLSLGVPRMFSSLEGEHPDNSVMVLGYVVMRLAMVFLWLRAARQDPRRRRACLTYVLTILIAQAGWTVLAFINPAVGPTFALVALLAIVEFSGPAIAERRDGGTPWHAHHIAERYSLLAIIALGEGVTGTVVSVSALVEQQGWSADAIFLCAAGVGLTLGMWWIYFVIPSAVILHKYRNRAFVWGYTHIALFAAIAATGAGLHVAGFYIGHKTELGPAAAMAAAATPVGVYVLLIYGLYRYLIRTPDPLHLWLFVATMATLCACVGLASVGVEITICLALLTFAPAVTIIGYETVAYRRGTAALQRELE